MPRINVKDTIVHERTFNDKIGKTQIMRSQRAALDLGGGYELPFRIGLGTGPVHPVGLYDLAPESFSLNQYGDLQLGRVTLARQETVEVHPVRAAPAPRQAG